MKKIMVRLEAVRAQEVIFAICMGLVAFLGRENPGMDYPELLWAFGIFLAFNLGYHLLLRTAGDRRLASLVSVAANSALITAILHYSGEADSYFWPMYLLPLFTACLHLERRHVLSAFAFVAGFLAYCYIEQFWSAGLMGGLEFLIKVSVLAFSAVVTFHVSLDERTARRALEKTRQTLNHMAQSLGETEERIYRRQNFYNLGRLAGGALHDLNNPLTIILGSVELLLRETEDSSPIREDLERIELAAGHCARLTSNLVAWSRFTHRGAAQADVGAVLGEMVGLFDYQIKTKNLDVRLEVPAGLPALGTEGAGLAVQSLLTLLIKVMGEAKQGSVLRLSAASRDGGIDIHLASPAALDEGSADDLKSCREMFSRAGGALEIRTRGEAVEYAARLPVAPAEPVGAR